MQSYAADQILSERGLPSKLVVIGGLNRTIRDSTLGTPYVICVLESRSGVSPPLRQPRDSPRGAGLFFPSVSAIPVAH